MLVLDAVMNDAHIRQDTRVAAIWYAVALTISRLLFFSDVLRRIYGI